MPRNRVLSIVFAFFFLCFSCTLCSGQDYTVPFPKPLKKQVDTVSLVFIGDVMMHSKQLDYDYKTFLEPIRSRLTEADLAVANMEFPLGGKPYTGYPVFSTPDGYADYVADCGVDVFLMANNHLLDKGTAGLTRTINYYEQMKEDGKIQYTGAYASAESDSLLCPLMVVVKGIKIALINFTYGSNLGGSAAWPKLEITNRDRIHRAVETAKEKGAEFIIALPHWGVEYELRHGKSQESLATFLSKEGVDAVIGAHPHVVQDTCKIGNTAVIYSMGNAISNMSAKNTRLELMVRVKIVPPHGNEKAKMMTPELEFMWCTLPGTLTDSYATIPVKEYIGKEHLWKEKYDYENMMSTYDRVKNQTGIDD